MDMETLSSAWTPKTLVCPWPNVGGSRVHDIPDLWKLGSESVPGTSTLARLWFASTYRIFWDLEREKWSAINETGNCPLYSGQDTPEGFDLCCVKYVEASFIPLQYISPADPHWKIGLRQNNVHVIARRKLVICSITNEKTCIQISLDNP